nr:zinc knuckle CX2CX4HX4C [Tanacetum cinerariifolium]
MTLEAYNNHHNLGINIKIYGKNQRTKKRRISPNKMQSSQDVIDHSEKVDSVEEVIGVCSGSNESNDGRCIEKENEVMSDEISSEKNANNPTTIPEQVKNKEKTPQEKSPSKSKEKIDAQNDKTPQKKAWSVHREILSAMRRSANKYSVLDLYDETELVELQKVRNSDRVEG